MAKKVRLTESDVHRLVEQAVYEALENEGLFNRAKNFMKGAFGQDVRNVNGAFNNAYNNVKRGAQNAYNNVKQGAQNAYNTAAQGVQNFQNGVNQRMQQGKQAYQNAKSAEQINSLKQNITSLIQSGVLRGQTAQAAQALLSQLGRQMGQYGGSKML